jgi:hypothetical protein
MAITQLTARRASTIRAGRSRRRRAWGVALAVLLSSLTVAAGAVEPDVHDRSLDIGALETLSRTHPFHLVQSTGNLYWTVNTDQNSNGVAFSQIYRMSKQGPPGTERVIYQESHDGGPYFAALTYAKLGSQYYAFFVVNDPEAHTSVIKRVSLGGGTAQRILTSPGYIGSRDLVTDGTYLFWADDKGLRRSKVDGTARATFLQSAGLGQVALSAARVFYADDDDIRSALKIGADFAFELRASSRVTDLSARFDGSAYSILRGETNGSVRASFRGGSGEVTYQAGSTGRRVSSVFTDGSRVFWTDCALGSGCRARVRSGGTLVSVPAGSFPDHIQGDGGGMYWADAVGLRKFS